MAEDEERVKRIAQRARRQNWRLVANHADIRCSAAWDREKT
jgi:hypothetical protein